MIKSVSICFTRGSNVISWAIRNLDRTFNGKPGVINHTLLRFVFDNGMDIIFQSHGIRGVGICYKVDIDRAMAAGKVVDFVEIPLNLTDDEKLVLYHKTTEITGTGYDHLLILAYYLAFRFGFTLPKFLGSDTKYTCNEAVCEVLSSLGKYYFLDSPNYTPTKLLEYFIGGN